MIDLSDIAPIPQAWLTWPLADADVEQALREAYRDGTWGHYHGPRGQELERCLAEFHQVDHALTCSSGTVAVTIALRGLHLPPESEVLLGGYDFPGNFRAIQEAGLRPVLVDIDPETWSIDPALVEEACSPETKAMVVSHLHGGLAPMPQVMELAARNGLLVVEDACQAPGAMIGDRRVASWGDVGVVSFGGSKLLTAGRGGAVLTNRPEVMQRARVYCERGNHAFPLSELQAAVLLPQLKKLPARDLDRAAAIRGLRVSLADLEGELSPVGCDFEHNLPGFYKHAWRCAGARGEEVRRNLLAAAEVLKLPLGEGFRGFTKRPASQCRQAGPLPHALEAAQRTVVLHHPILLQDAQAIDLLSTAIRKVIERSQLQLHQTKTPSVSDQGCF